MQEEKVDQQSKSTDSVTSVSEVKNSLPDDVGEYAIALCNTPILNTPAFDSVYGGKDGKSLAFNSNGLIKQLEYIAFPGTAFKILSEIKYDDHSILEIATNKYQISSGSTSAYIDSRFVKRLTTAPKGETIMMPSKKRIYEYLDSAVGAPYVWGGNCIRGVDSMMKFYEPAGKISKKVYNHWCMKGVDCSGLLYEATQGYTIRSTHQLVNFGHGLKISGKSAEEIADMVDSLDMIVWKGHVIYVYDKSTTIESSHSAGGVVMKDLVRCLENIMRTREPADEWDDSEDKIFVVRRWW